jgi:toxin YoeB
LKKIWTDEAWDDYEYWLNQDKKTVKRINKLLKDIERNGNMHGIGKPEPLQYDLQGLYSRRIDDKNRLVYVADGEGLFIVSCRYHYE